MSAPALLMFLFLLSGAATVSPAAKVISAVPAGPAETAPVRQSSAVENSVSFGSGEGANGDILSIAVNLNNDVQVRALQFDLTYDPGVVQFAAGGGRERGAEFIATFGSSAAGQIRAVFHFEDNSSIPVGSGQVGVLDFWLVGGKNASTTLVPTGIILSDPKAQEFTVTGASGSVLVTRGPAQVPTFQIVTLKNPGRIRTFRAFVRVENGSGTTPTVRVDDVGVTPVEVELGLYTFSYFASSGTGAVTIFASDTNAEGTGTGQQVVTVE